MKTSPLKKAPPFYSQKWDLSKWQDLGFDSYEDAKYWEGSSCGILCLKMAMDTFLAAQSKSLSPSVHNLIQKGLELGAYSNKKGWDHEGLARIAKNFGFSAFRKEPVSVEEVKGLLADGLLPIVSIKWAFKNHKGMKERLLFWKKYGGHLVLVIDFEKKNGEEGFRVHHTSIRKEYNWENKFISMDTFKRTFTGRCVVIKG